MAITPDTKDWTWVLERPCPQCGFDASSFGVGDIVGMLRSNIDQWPALLAAPHVRERPDDSTWSPLEYGAHVRDVFRVFRGRLRLMLTEVDPEFTDWDQDAAAAADRYDQQDPASVTRELVDAGTAIADMYASVTPEQWGRTGRRSDGAQFTVDSFAKYLLHDVIHHIDDVRNHPRTDLPAPQENE